MSKPDPVFEAPWHAQVFALTVHLNEAGHFTWPDWAQAFSETLARHGLEKDLNGGDDYFTAWLETLEALLDAHGTAASSDVARVKHAWEHAYMNTPHGQPVHLDD